MKKENKKQELKQLLRDYNIAQDELYFRTGFSTFEDASENIESIKRLLGEKVANYKVIILNKAINDKERKQYFDTKEDAQKFIDTTPSDCILYEYDEKIGDYSDWGVE